MNSTDLLNRLELSSTYISRRFQTAAVSHVSIMKQAEALYEDYPMAA